MDNAWNIDGKAFREVTACLRRFGDLEKNTFLKILGSRDWGNPLPGAGGTLGAAVVCRFFKKTSKNPSRQA